MQTQKAVRNIYRHIASTPIDQKVGIRLAHLAGDEAFSLYGAQISPHTKMGAHYHQIGMEIYLILEGEAIMHTGAREINNSVRWNAPFTAKKGDYFTIAPEEVHQLFNGCDENLVVLFGCPQSHSTTDRIMVQGVENGADGDDK